MATRYVCPFCDAVFYRATHFVRHVRERHLDGSTRCPVCSRVFVNSHALVSHVAKAALSDEEHAAVYLAMIAYPNRGRRKKAWRLVLHA